MRGSLGRRIEFVVCFWWGGESASWVVGKEGERERGRWGIGTTFCQFHWIVLEMFSWETVESRRAGG